MVIKWPFSGPLMALDKPDLYQNYKVNEIYRILSDAALDCRIGKKQRQFANMSAYCHLSRCDYGR
jgi:hypothetical protein